MSAINPRHDSRAVRKLYAAMKRKGWSDGSRNGGIFCALLMVSPDGKSVLKVAHDPVWHEFISLAHAEPHKNLPRVSHVRTFRKGKSGSVTVAVMERLEHLDASATWESDPYMYKAVRKAQNVANARGFFSLDRGSIRPSTAKIIRILEAKIGRTPNDLHMGNMMVRRGPNGGCSLVLTDPFAF